MFSSRKAAQIAAFFLEKNGNRINVLKLMKLLYLADRESFQRYGEPISFDMFISMDNGPALSKTLNLINGFVKGEESANWEDWISDRDSHDVSLKKTFHIDDLDELSEAQIEILDFVWKQFGWMNQWELVDYTHNNCPEWENPYGSSTPISEKNILTALAVPEEEIEACIEEYESQRSIDRLLLQF